MTLALEREALSVEPLIERVRAYNPDVDADLLRRAYARAEQAHAGQVRDSGAPYLAHPLAVAHILVEIGSDAPTLAAAMLHGVVEDTRVDLETIEAVFVDEGARLGDGGQKRALADRRRR